MSIFERKRKPLLSAAIKSEMGRDIEEVGHAIDSMAKSYRRAQMERVLEDSVLFPTKNGLRLVKNKRKYQLVCGGQRFIARAHIMEPRPYATSGGITIDFEVQALDLPMSIVAGPLRDIDDIEGIEGA